jgi:hypothetical protein
MACDTRRVTVTFTIEQRVREIAAALDRLEVQLASGKVAVKVGAQGAVAFTGWKDRDEVTDVCAYRKLMQKGSPILRRALARAEALAGRKVDERQILAGMHSHDGGQSWGRH